MRFPKSGTAWPNSEVVLSICHKPACGVTRSGAASAEKLSEQSSKLVVIDFRKNVCMLEGFVYEKRLVYKLRCTIIVSKLLQGAHLCTR